MPNSTRRKRARQDTPHRCDGPCPHNTNPVSATAHFTSRLTSATSHVYSCRCDWSNQVNPARFCATTQGSTARARATSQAYAFPPGATCHNASIHFQPGLSIPLRRAFSRQPVSATTQSDWPCRDCPSPFHSLRHAKTSHTQPMRQAKTYPFHSLQCDKPTHSASNPPDVTVRDDTRQFSSLRLANTDHAASPRQTSPRRA